MQSTWELQYEQNVLKNMATRMNSLIINSHGIFKPQMLENLNSNEFKSVF